MKKITKKQMLDIIAQTGEGNWTSRIEKTGHGDYGKREIFSFNGKPIVAVEIDFTQAKTTAYDVR